ncbi:MAG: PLDc N-terminal domain-containing protein, partial [Firmicutes bacterium]|nr:PLDc N-terminal domain-containing protein [Bacillota bacterium]
MFLRKLLRFLYSRVFIICLLLVVQLTFILSTIIVLNDSYWLVSIFTTIASIGIVLVLINNQEQNPSTKLAWILVVLLLPIVGATLYLMFGSHYASLKLRKQVLKVIEDSAEVMPDKSQVITDLEKFDPAMASQCK